MLLELLAPIAIEILTCVADRLAAHAMNYHDGSPVKLGDIVAIPMSGGSARARVVMLGDTREHLKIDQGFLEWAEGENLLDASHVIVEWIDENPLAHNDPQYAPVGNYMFTALDSCVNRVDA
jgi:hypothetical protein